MSNDLNSPANSNSDKKDEETGDPEENKGKKNRKFSNDESSSKKHVDPHFKRLLWHLICSTRGGVNRAKILHVLIENPSNANQISTQLKLDYKTITHHLDVLKKNGLVITENEDSYGATYFTSPIMERNYFVLDEIMDRIGKK